MEIIAKISKGTKMDQIYIPKNRTGFSSGEYVLITSIKDKIESQDKQVPKLFFYNVTNLEPVKVRITEDIFTLIEKQIKPENIIITGSFLEPGFKFNDIDILVITDKKDEEVKSKIKELTGINSHIIFLTNNSLIQGISSDPLYSLMLSKCISTKRIIFKIKRNINYKILDLHLLKSKSLIDNFDILSGDDKYYLTLNMLSILMFVQGRKLSKERVNREIERIFNLRIEEIRDNLLEKQNFLKKYKETYSKIFNLIMGGIKNEQK